MADEVDVRKLREDADAANRRGEWKASLPLWQSVRSSDPDSPEGYLGAARALRELGLGREAEALLQDGVRRLPDNLALAAEGAWMATRSGATGAAAIAWEQIVTRFPQEAVGYIGLAATLIDIKRPHIADVVLLGARAMFPGSARIAVDCARVAEGRNRLDEARGRWLEVIEKFPTATVGYSGLAQVLLRLGRAGEAEETIEKAVQMFPGDLNLAVAHAEHVMHMRRWDEATRLWRRVLDDFSLPESVRKRANGGIGEIELSRKLDAVDAPSEPGIVAREASAPAAAVPKPDQPADIQLLTSVQGMGHDCEFGLLQRQHGFEPLSLLRWTGSLPPGLIMALERDFDGLGDPDRSAIEVRGGEYVFGSYEYGMITHTFMRHGMIEQDSLFEKLCTRMSYLKRKFLEDLEEGGKVLLYKAPPNTDDDTLDRLYASLQRHNTNFLLVAKTHDQDDETHYIEQPRDGMVVAYRPASATRVDNWTAATQSWLTILRMSLGRFQLPVREDETVA